MFGTVGNVEQIYRATFASNSFKEISTDELCVCDIGKPSGCFLKSRPVNVVPYNLVDLNPAFSCGGYSGEE